MKQYEYLVMTFDGKATDVVMEDKLFELGAEGFELVSVVPTWSPPGNLKAFLKRERQEQTHHARDAA